MEKGSEEKGSSGLGGGSRREEKWKMLQLFRNRNSIYIYSTGEFYEKSKIKINIYSLKPDSEK